MCIRGEFLFFVVALSVVLVGCGEKSGVEEAKSSTQAAAKVNGEEISIHQVNFQLGRLSNSKPLTELETKSVSEEILSRLVEQQILRQKALETKLDRDPRVLQVIESTKDELLARAYLEQVLSKATKPNSDQIDKFYKENPELFERRRVFRLQELTVDVDKSKFEEIDSNIKSFNNINDIANWLTEKGYAFNANSNVRAAEQLPQVLLKKIQPLKDGEFVSVFNDKSFNIIHIAASQLVPVSREKATPIIEQYFISQSKALIAKNELASLHNSAKVEFLGTFAGMNKTYKAGAVNSVVNADFPKGSAVSESTSDKQSQSNVVDAANMDKGLSGL